MEKTKWNKRIRYLIQRIKLQKSTINSLENKNSKLSSELNNKSLSLASVQREYDALNEKYNVQKECLRALQEKELTIRQAFEEIDRDVLTVIQPLTRCSQTLLNLKKKITEEFKKTERKNESSNKNDFPFRENKIGTKQDKNKNTATVNPMIRGYVFKTPTVALERLSANQLLNCPADSRTSNHNTIPRTHSEPVVRLRDVSRLLNNTSLINLNLQSFDERTSESHSRIVTFATMGENDVSQRPSTSINPENGQFHNGMRGNVRWDQSENINDQSH